MFRDRLASEGLLDGKGEQKISAAIAGEIAEAFDRAEKAPFPLPDSLFVHAS
jgi:TPP-dependent pyruvate/acetoin dehydrogenase alpha subunit